MIKVYRGPNETFIARTGAVVSSNAFSFDALFRSGNPLAYVDEKFAEGAPSHTSVLDREAWLPPLENQEVWAAGVTYFRSREARMEESERAGGDAFYDLVYEAPRPELFFKATAARARGHGAPIRVRRDSHWDVPEPELTLAINAGGEVFGYTIGNDVSSRDIEGQNPLYLPQAKVYRGSCALGPCLCLCDPPPGSTEIRLTISRNGAVAFEDKTCLAQLKRSFAELAEFLFRDNEFPCGCWLMTGTGIVPPNDFTLQSGDQVTIEIDGIGALENRVE